MHLSCSICSIYIWKKNSVINLGLDRSDRKPAIWQVRVAHQTGYASILVRTSVTRPILEKPDEPDNSFEKLRKKAIYPLTFGSCAIYPKYANHPFYQACFWMSTEIVIRMAHGTIVLALQTPSSPIIQPRLLLTTAAQQPRGTPSKLAMQPFLNPISTSHNHHPPCMPCCCPNPEPCLAASVKPQIRA